MPAFGDRRGGVVLGREDVAGRPAHLGAEGDQRLDQDGGLDGHVQRAGDAGALERLRGRRTPRGWPSGRASRARRAGSPCGRNRPGRGRRPCSRLLRNSGHTVSGGGLRWWRPAAASRRSCFSCSKRSQSAAGTSSGRWASTPARRRVAWRSSPRVRSPQGEREIGEPDVVRRATRAGCAGAGARRAVEAVPGRGRLPSYEPDALHVAQHPRAPARGLSRLVDGQRVHWTPV